MDNRQQGSSQSFVKAMLMPATRPSEKDQISSSVKLKSHLHLLYQPKARSMGTLTMLRHVSLLMLDTIKISTTDWLKAKADAYSQVLLLDFQPVENKIGCYSSQRKNSNKSL